MTKKNGFYITRNDISKYFNIEKRFKNESLMCDYIETNIVPFCRELFDDEYISHEREKRIANKRYKRRVGFGFTAVSRIDFIIKCEKKNYFVEIKNPRKNSLDQERTFGQILKYKMHIDRDFENARCVVVSSLNLNMLSELRDYYRVDFDIYLFNKERSLKI